jgi:hypothetical protein
MLRLFLAHVFSTKGNYYFTNNIQRTPLIKIIVINTYNNLEMEISNKNHIQCTEQTYCK